MVGEHTVDKEKTCLLPNPLQHLDKSAAEALTAKELKALESTGGDKLQLAGLKPASADWHKSRSISAEQSR